MNEIGGGGDMVVRPLVLKGFGKKCIHYKNTLFSPSQYVYVHY
uniref:Uncharacterized protein n=1 Tax=Lepeophtheirus salmonis TaxID=72036 RepID=A0A0K2V7J0_LEPSM